MAYTVLRNPSTNKGLSFSLEERDKHGLRGLLPPVVNSIEACSDRVISMLRRIHDPLDRYCHLMQLQTTNENLFYYVVMNHTSEILPLIYTPVVGEACQKYSLVWARPQGLFVSVEDRGHVGNIVANWPEEEVKVVVVTDGERILGLGDLGANGQGIPVGKLNIYTACGGVHPRGCLPITLDVGTNNTSLREDPLYIGSRTARTRGQVYDDLVDELLTALVSRWPNVLIQFEDFGNENAFRLLERYQNKICTFNDDIQGTASVVVSGLFSACRVKGTRFSDETFLCFGAGEASVGVCNLLVLQMMKEGVSEEEARKRCYLIDSKGLITKSRLGSLAHHKQKYAHEHEQITSLIDCVKSIKPTALIGASAQGGAFTPEIIRLMMEMNERPIIFPLSNPTSCSECTAETAFAETNGKVLFASGSPFDDVFVGGERKCPGQGNNAYIFPGVGFGVTAVAASRVTDEMFLIAAETVARCVTEEDLKVSRLYPSLDRIREVSTKIAIAIAKHSKEQGLTRVDTTDQIETFVTSQLYDPQHEMQSKL